MAREERDARTARVRVGFPGNEREVEVAVPEGDPAPWSLETRLRVVDTAVPRVDGVAKVTGAARYAGDHNLPGLLHGAILRCPHPRARVRRLDLEAAARAEGVAATVAARREGSLCRFAGYEVAAVAAATPEQAEAALEKIVVEYEVLDFNTDPLAARGAPVLDEAGNVARTSPEERNAEIEQALAGAAVVREATYATQCQTHTSLETHGCTAHFQPDGKLKVWASTQGTFATRQQIAGALGMAVSDVQVVTEFMGGGFGSKLQAGAEIRLCAELSREAKQPVRLLLSRKEEHIATGNRPLTIQHVRAGLDAEGHIVAWDHRSWGNGGYTGRGGRTTSPWWYFKPGTPARREGTDLATDLDPARPMRAPGWPQGFFAFECMLDELADAAGMDPIALRLKNNHSDRAALWRHELELGAQRIGWERNRNHTPGRGDRLLRGVGCSAAAWGGAGGGRHQVFCRIHPDGTVEMRNGAQDIGTGMKTVLAVLCAEELGIPPGRVKVYMGDTSDPAGPGSGGSTTTPSLAPAARQAAWRAGTELLERVAGLWEVPPDRLVFQEGRIAEREGGRSLSFREACRLLGTEPIEAVGTRFRNFRNPDYASGVCGAMFAHVEVDTHSGIVRVLKMVGVQDCGRVINRLTAESQVLGAMIQGISYVFHEDKVIDHRLGRMLNPDLLFYKVSGPKDMPEMEAHMVTVSTGHTSVGAMGLGEPPAVGVPAALANAVRNAIGTSVRALPMTPDRVLAALAARED